MAAMVYSFPRLEKLGRLGNQLWQIASTIGIAEKNEGRALFNPNWEYRPFFNVPDEYFGNLPKHYIDAGDYVNDEYLQKLRYWVDLKDHILDIFSINPKLEPELNLLWEAASFGRPTTAIHVRRGDYLKYPRAHPVCTPKYYMSAIELVKEIEPNTQFIVFSDDPDYCEGTLFKGMGFTFVRGVVRPVEIVDRKKSVPEDYWDLQLIAKCDRHIISNSSFAWWGAVLSRDDSVFYPSIWYGPDNSYIDWKAMIPATWIEVKC